MPRRILVKQGTKLAKEGLRRLPLIKNGWKPRELAIKLAARDLAVKWAEDRANGAKLLRN